MKIKTWIKYEESYLPPRCRKLRYRECEEYVNVNLREANSSELKLAFEDNSYEGKGKIYLFGNKLWNKAKIRNICAGEECENYHTPLEAMQWWNEHGSYYFPRLWRDGEHPDRQRMLLAARKDMRNYLLVDGELYVRTSEPRYCINTFGLGHNHGGTGMFCDYSYNPNIRNDNYFSAIDGEKAVAYANAIAERRGDTNDVGKFEPFIIVHMPEIVKVKPKKQHGNGDKFMNDVENIIQNSDDTLTAGLLCMTLLK